MLNKNEMSYIFVTYDKLVLFYDIIEHIVICFVIKIQDIVKKYVEND